MSWQGQMTTVVRHMINDLDSDSYTYTNTRLEKAILVSVQLTLMNVDFVNTYLVNTEACTLSPDPTETATLDNAFIALICLRTACLILGGEIRSESGNAISIKDGPSAIDLKGVTQTLTMLYKDLCQKYETLLLEYRAGNSVAGVAILGPYSPGSDAVSNNLIDHRSGGYLN